MKPKEINETFELTEYEEANEWWRTLSKMRRQDMTLFITLQGAVVTVIGPQLLHMDPKSIVLSIFAFSSTLLAFNNERRLYGYLYGFRQRALEIEKKRGMALIKSGLNEVGRKKILMRSSVSISWYYALIAICWIVLWILNFVQP
ncbi:MAG: hypothetical protein HZB19_03345 [Chloroflexi bacterium]|nr:hypothetical protein [Chloroflexota bacterium]